MQIKQFVVLLMALLMLGKNAVCQQTFDSATKIWQEQSCIFPDKSAYINTSNIVPKLEQCRLLDNKNISADSDGVSKNLCQLFYSVTFNICQNKNKTWQDFTQRCLKPDLLLQRKPFAEKEICIYAFETKIYAKFFSFLQTSDQCQLICGVNSIMRDVCELYAFIFYQLEHCSEIEQRGTEKPNSVATSNHGENELTSVTQKSPTAPSTSNQTESTSTAQLTGLVSENKTTQGLKGFDNVSTNKALNTAGNNTTSTSIDNETQRSEYTSATKEPPKPADSLKTPAPIGDQPLLLPDVFNQGSKSSDSSKEILKSSASVLISTITSAITKQIETTEMTPTQEEEESTAIDNQSTSQEKVDDGGDDLNSDDQDESPPEENILDTDEPHTVEGDKSKSKTQGANQAVNPLKDYDDDTESSPGSGHFLAYFLTAVVICISGYIIYHNKQKILAFIIEGRNSGRGKRQRSKDVKYTQLKSSVEEVMPSLEQTATGKNFVY
ncbi:hypothetical protein BsWGS_05850 [Bradybaena similaris]